MKYLLIPLLLLVEIYPMSYAAYNWRRKNWLGAVGMMLLSITAFVVPTVLLMLR